MKKSILILIIILEIIIVLGLAAGAVYLHQSMDLPEAPPSFPTIAAETMAVPTATEATTIPENTVPETTQSQPPRYILSFAGDCTLGNFAEDYGSEGSFMDIVGNHYNYPFENVRKWFSKDEFTFVNFEGTLTDSTETIDKDFNFHAPPDYAKILTAGSVEAVNLANNHTYDYGETGFQDTMSALEQENIPYVLSNDTLLYTTEHGLTIGIYSSNFGINIGDMPHKLAQLRDSGAEIIIVSMHWGTEMEYTPEDEQIQYAHMAIDAGADIVFGHHPHVLQPMETYGDGLILYSMGNFSFGGNFSPSDMDTAIFQQEVIRNPDGTVGLGEHTIIPCSVSSDESYNNYQPTPYKKGTPEYDRVLSKLAGTYQQSES